MARLQWNQEINKKYALGLDRGVLYIDGELAVPWNGLISVTETPISESVESYYFDGVKYFDKKHQSVYQMNITALTFPDAFMEAIGHRSLVPGFLLTKQEKIKFNLSYRTKIGDVLGYQIHLVYNAIVKSSDISNETLKDTSDLKTQSWIVDTVPLSYSGHSPSSYIVFNSIDTDPKVLSYLEALIYGSEDSVPRLPNMFELSNIFEYWKPVRVNYDPSGFSILSPEFGDLFRTRLDGIFIHNMMERLKLTSTSGFYRLEP